MISFISDHSHGILSERNTIEENCKGNMAEGFFVNDASLISIFIIRYYCSAVACSGHRLLPVRCTKSRDFLDLTANKSLAVKPRSISQAFRTCNKGVIRMRNVYVAFHAIPFTASDKLTDGFGRQMQPAYRHDIICFGLSQLVIRLCTSTFMTRYQTTGVCRWKNNELETEEFS